MLASWVGESLCFGDVYAGSLPSSRVQPHIQVYMGSPNSTWGVISNYRELSITEENKNLGEGYKRKAMAEGNYPYILDEYVEFQ